MYAVILAVLTLGSLLTAGDAGSVPKCDPAITGKMSEYYPKGIPNNIIKSIRKNGQYSYILVSSWEAKYLGMGVRCIGISMPKSNKAQVAYKLSSLPTAKKSFPVKESNGVLYQKDGDEYKLYVVYMSDDGVIVTYRCCDKCTGTAPDVGIAVANKLKDKKATKAAVDAAKAKLHELGLDKDVSPLPYCS